MLSLIINTSRWSTAALGYKKLLVLFIHQFFFSSENVTHEMAMVPCVCVYVLVAESCLILHDPKDCSPLGFSAMGFPRQEYWSGLPCPPPGDLPDPGIEPRSPALQADSLSSEPQCHWVHIVVGNTQPTYQHFSNFHDHGIHFLTLLKCRF